MSTSKIVMKIVSISFSILIFVLIIFGFFKLGGFAYDFGYRVFTEQPVAKEPGKDVIVQIEKGMTGDEIAILLEDKGLITDANLFRVQLKLSSYDGRLLPGVYTLNTSMTAKEMMQCMATSEKDKEKDTEKSSTEKKSAEQSSEEQSSGK